MIVGRLSGKGVAAVTGGISSLFGASESTKNGVKAVTNCVVGVGVAATIIGFNFWNPYVWGAELADIVGVLADTADLAAGEKPKIKKDPLITIALRHHNIPT